jgi:restriction system protein
MGKAKQQLRTLIEGASLLPWWLALLLAPISYALIHLVYLHFSGQVSATTQGVNALSSLGAKLQDSIWSTVALFAQWGVPIILILGAALNAFKRRQAWALFTAASRSLDNVQRMHWQEFERLIAEAFRRQGYRVLETGGGGADGGVDILLTRDGQRTLVQCKHWKTRQIGVAVVREMYGIMTANGAARVKIVTSGSFTLDAHRFARGKPIDLLGRSDLAQLIAGVPDVTSTGDGATDPAAPTVPACPRCGRPMVRRQAKRGANAGKIFWGCSGYPECHGTLEM